MAAAKRAPQRTKDRHGPLAGRWGRVGRPETFTTASMVSAVIEARGRLTAAASILGCDSDTISRRAARSAELRRAIVLMRADGAQRTAQRQERRRRARAREQEARGAALQAERAYRPSPVVELVFINEEPTLVGREGDAADGAPPIRSAQGANSISNGVSTVCPGRRHDPPPWATGDWRWVRLVAPVEAKHYGALAAGDEVLVPPRQASGWALAGVAEVIAESR